MTAQADALPKRSDSNAVEKMLRLTRLVALPGPDCAARCYAATPDGIIPKDEMTPALKLGQIARVPPASTSGA